MARFHQRPPSGSPAAPAQTLLCAVLGGHSGKGVKYGFYSVRIHIRSLESIINEM